MGCCAGDQDDKNIDITKGGLVKEHFEKSSRTAWILFCQLYSHQGQCKFWSPIETIPSCTPRWIDQHATQTNAQ